MTHPVHQLASGRATLRSQSERTAKLTMRAELSGGRSLDLNVDLVVNNSRIAAQVASAMA